MKNKKILAAGFIFIGIIVILFSFILTLNLALYLPEIGDSSLHYGIIKEIKNTGFVLRGIDRVRTYDGNSYVIQYPQTFYVLFTTFNEITNLDPIVLNISLLYLEIFILFLIFRLFFKKNKEFFILSLIILSFFPIIMLFSSLLYMELLVSFIIIFSFYMMVKGITSKISKYTYLAILFSVFLISVKQIGYIILGINLIFLLFYYGKSKVYLKHVLLAAILLATIIPILGLLNHTNGSIFFVTDSSTLNKIFLFNDNYHKIDPEYVPAISMLNQNPGRDTVFGLENLKEFYNPATYFYHEAHFLEPLFIIVILLNFSLFMKAIKKGNSILLYLFLFVFFSHVTLYFLRTQRYFIYLMMLFSLLFSTQFIFLKNFNKKARVIILALIIILSTISISFLAQDGQKSNYSRYYNIGFLSNKNSLLEITNLLKPYDQIDTTVLYPYTNGYELLYYLDNLKIVSFTPFGMIGLRNSILYDDPKKLNANLLKYDIDFIVFSKRAIFREPLTHIAFVTPDSIEKLRSLKDYYNYNETEGYIVFKIKDEKST